MRVLFVNGHVWQSGRQREPPASWLLISGPEGGRNACGKVVDVGVGDAPEEHRLAPPALQARPMSPPPSPPPLNSPRLLCILSTPSRYTSAENKIGQLFRVGAYPKSGTADVEFARLQYNSTDRDAHLPFTLSGLQNTRCTADIFIHCQ